MKTIVARDMTIAFANAEVTAREVLPWGGERCDVLVAIVDQSKFSKEVADRIATELVQMNIDWADTMGAGAELLHDFIDECSVAAGLQLMVGDGIPMTAWHEEMGVAEMAEFVARGGMGGYERKLVVVVGADEVVARFVDEVEAVLPRREKG
jgi:hypothetical protein